jgi:tetratricopeptide (TPR) repeat protein
MSASSISQYETGKKFPELKSLMRVLAAMGYGYSDLDKARFFLLSLRSRGGPVEGGHGIGGTELHGTPDILSAQIASMAAAAGEAVSRLTEGIAFLVRQRPSPVSSESRTAGSTSSGPSPDDRAHAATLWERLQRYPSPLQEALVREVRDFQNWALCEHLCHESERRASRNVAVAVQLGKLAIQIAELVSGEKQFRYRLHSYALAFCANALRVEGNLREAEEAFTKAEELWQLGEGSTINLLEKTRLLDLKASLRRSQRRLPDALQLIERALEIDKKGAYTGHLLIKKAKTIEEIGDLEKAIAILKEAAPFVGSDKDPRLFLCLKHNLADYLSKAQQYAEAESLLPEVKAICGRLGNELDLIRLRWVEARIADGLGRTDQAASILAKVRGDFASRNMHYDTALVSLELATILAREGRPDQVKALARHMTSIFQAQGVHREALAALALFRQAAESEKVTPELAGRILDYLHRARYNPKLRFKV